MKLWRKHTPKFISHGTEIFAPPPPVAELDPDGLPPYNYQPDLSMIDTLEKRRRTVPIDTSTCPDRHWHRPNWSPDCLGSDHEHDRCDLCGFPVRLAGLHTPQGVFCLHCRPLGHVQDGHSWECDAAHYEQARDAERWLRWRKAHQ